MLFLDGVYVERPNGWVRFRWVKAPTSAEVTQLADRIARRVGRYLERHGLLERDAQHSYLAGETVEADPMDQLLGHSITYRIAVGPQQGRKVFTLQTLPAWDDSFGDEVGKVAGFSLHAGVMARADERQKLERLCRYISRPVVSEKRLSLTPNGNIRYDVNGITSVAGARMRRSDPAQDALPGWHHPCHFPATGLHCPAGGPGAKTAGESDTISWCICPEQQTPCPGHPGQARQGQQGQGMG